MKSRSHALWHVRGSPPRMKRPAHGTLQRKSPPNTAPATKNDPHDWSLPHMRRHLQSARAGRSNLAKYCACHEKWLSWRLILVTYEPFTLRRATGVTPQPHQILPNAKSALIGALYVFFYSFALVYCSFIPVLPLNLNDVSYVHERISVTLVALRSNVYDFLRSATVAFITHVACVALPWPSFPAIHEVHPAAKCSKKGLRMFETITHNFYRHIFVWFIYSLPCEMSGTASCGTMGIHFHLYIFVFLFWFFWYFVEHIDYLLGSFKSVYSVFIIRTSGGLIGMFACYKTSELLEFPSRPQWLISIKQRDSLVIKYL